MKVYSGKLRTEERELGIAKNAFLELLQGLLDQGRILYVDNFYTSYELALYLLAKQTHVVETLMLLRLGGRTETARGVKMLCAAQQLIARIFSNFMTFPDFYSFRS